MSIKRIFAATLACLALGHTLSWGQCTSWTTSTIQKCNGHDYELWNQENAGTVKLTITSTPTSTNGGTFDATWNSTINILFRAGKKWGTNSTTTAKSIGNISLDFAATWSSGDDVKMLGVYGWAYYPASSIPKQTETGVDSVFTNQIEYYIIQDRGTFNPASGGRNAKRYGEGTIDGIAYEYWVADRLGEANLTGKGNFKQYFSVPKLTTSHRQSGKVTISKHFEEWERVGMKMMDCPLYEVAMKVESYTGSKKNSSGSASVTKNLLTLGGSGTTEYNLATTIFPTGAGTVTKAPNTTYYAPNSTVQLTATPSAGWKFVGWEGDATGTTNATTITMSKDRAVTAKFELISGDGTTNLIKDGNFPSSSVISTSEGASWRLAQGQYWGNSVATSSVTSGTATINVTTIGTATYQPQLVQYGLGLDMGMSYKLTFKAKAATARKIEASFQMSTDPWTGYASKEFDLSTTEKDYEYIFTMTSASDPAAQFAFNIGQTTGSVTFSDVKLVHTSTGPSTIFRGYTQSKLHNAPLIFVVNKTLNILPTGTNLQVKIFDLTGKIKANFNAHGASAHSLANMPSGRYLVDVTGAGIKQVNSIILE